MFRSLLIIGLMTGLSASALADTIWIASRGTVLTRVTEPDDGGVPIIESFTAPPVSSLYRAPDSGRIFGITSTPTGPQDLYELRNVASGTPNFEYVSALDKRYPSATYVDGLIYAVARVGDSANLYSIDPDTFPTAQSVLVGPTGLLSLEGGNPVQGLAYDPATDQLYALSGHFDALYTVNRDTGAATLVAEMPFDVRASGTEWFDGQITQRQHRKPGIRHHRRGNRYLYRTTHPGAGTRYRRGSRTGRHS